MTTLTASCTQHPQPRDFAVTLISREVDEFGIPYEHKVGVMWDAGVAPDWDEWLQYFNDQEGEEYFYESVLEVTNAPEEF